MAHRLVHRAAVAKAHLDLGGVHVHIHQRRVDLHEQRIGRLLVAVQHVFVGAARTVHDHFVAHKAAIHIRKLVVGARARGVGEPCAAHHFERSGVVFHRDGLRHELITQHIGQALLQASCTRVHAPLLHQLALVPDGKAHVGAGQGVAAHGFDAVRQLGAVAFQKFAAGGGREKQLFDLHRGAHSAGGRADFAGLAIERERGGLAVHTREQSQFRHRVDSRQRLAPKAHGHDRFEVIQVADLAGGVALQGRGQLVRGDAAAVVFD